MTEEEHYQESQKKFEQAITEGRLTAESTDDHFAGHYMYMGEQNGRSLFKNIITRNYDV